MKILKVVYSAECEHSDWDGGNSQHYVGEDSWQVGEKFNGDFVKGTISHISDEETGYMIYVRPEGERVYQVNAMLIPPHAVQRVYYGEE